MLQQKLQATGEIHDIHTGDPIRNLITAVDAICAACPDMGAALSFRCFVDIHVKGSVVVMTTRYPVSILTDKEGNYWSVIELR